MLLHCSSSLFLMNARKLANKLGALKNQLIFSAHVQDTGVGRKKRGIQDTTVDGMKINRDDLRSLFLFILLILFCCIVSS